MGEVPPLRLDGCRLLVVEDEYIVASDLAFCLGGFGAQVVGPVGTVRHALEILVKQGERLDGAVLDLNLNGEPAYPVADALIARGIPFVFATGYDDLVIAPAYAAIPRCAKPVDKSRLAELLAVGCAQPRR